MSAPKIVTRCPCCGGQTLFIGAGGHLTCSRLDCRVPSVEEMVERYVAALRVARTGFATVDERGLHLTRGEAIALYDEMDNVLCPMTAPAPHGGTA